jgi:hypothetical protein
MSSFEGQLLVAGDEQPPCFRFPLPHDDDEEVPFSLFFLLELLRTSRLSLSLLDVLRTKGCLSDSWDVFKIDSSPCANKKEIKI